MTKSRLVLVYRVAFRYLWYEPASTEGKRNDNTQTESFVYVIAHLSSSIRSNSKRQMRLKNRLPTSDVVSEMRPGREAQAAVRQSDGSFLFLLPPHLLSRHMRIIRRRDVSAQEAASDQPGSSSVFSVVHTFIFVCCCLGVVFRSLGWGRRQLKA
jgi:hypothetical protein